MLQMPNFNRYVGETDTYIHMTYTLKNPHLSHFKLPVILILAKLMEHNMRFV